MASIKVILRKNKKRPDGTFPLVIRVTKDRKTSEFFIGHYIKEEEWDHINKKVKKSHLNSARINHKILKKTMEASEVLLDVENGNKDLSKKAIKHKIKNHNKSSFVSVAEEHLSDLLKLKKFTQHCGEKPRVNHFISFLEGGDISFQEITSPLLKKFMIYLKADKNLSDRSVMNTLIVIRTIFNKAINNGLVDHKFYPFGPGKIQIRMPESIKMGLNAEELNKLENAELTPYSNEWHARNTFLTSFYLAGIRVSDVIRLKWTDFNDGRLIYIMGKNKKVVSLKLPEKVNEILEKYKPLKNESPFIFPYLQSEDMKDLRALYGRTRSANGGINKTLNRIAKDLGIEKNITMHISRHTFGNLAGDKISPQLLQKLYRHSDLKTTIGYQANFINQDVDSALEAVLKF